MAKKFVKMMAAMLALCMCVSMMAVPAFAVEEVESTQKTDGTTVIKTTTTTEDTDENGNKTITVTVTEKTDPEDNEDNSGATVKYEQTTKTETTTDADGNLIKEQESGSGSEIKDWTVEDDGSAPGQTKVTVTLKPGETTSGSATTTTTSGNVKDSESDKNYFYTETTVTDRVVTATASEVKQVVNETSSSLTPVGSEDNPDGSKKQDQYYDSTHYHYDKHNAGKITVDYEKKPEGADYAYVGSAEYSHKYITVLDVTYQRDEDGNILYDENGEPLIDHLNRAWNDIVMTDSDGNVIQDLDRVFTTGSRPTMFWLKNENGEYVCAYCSDAETGTDEGEWYKVVNLEDSDYYAEGAAAHVRAVVENGYWGTASTGPDADGNYETGSLDQVKKNLKDALAAGEIKSEYDFYYLKPVVDENGKTTYVETHATVALTAEMIDEWLTEGAALDATQAAVWTWANNADVDKIVYKGAIEGKTFPSEEGSACRMALYEWLISLESEAAETVVINEKNYVENFTLTVGDKAADEPENQDDNADNDVYEAELSFVLKFVPSQEKDDLILYLLDADGNPILDADGNEIVRRLAGASKESEEFGMITPVDGVYTIEGLKLSENEEFTFDLRLEGAQYLEKGAYFYAAFGGRKTTQSMVGYAEGYKTVDVSASMNISFSVDEEDKYHAEAYWSWENDPVYPPEEPTETPENPTPTPEDPTPTPEDPTPSEEITEIPDETPLDTPEEPEEELEEIPEDIPMAEVPKTGDESGMWTVMMILAAMSLLGLAVTGRKSLKA